MKDTVARMLAKDDFSIWIPDCVEFDFSKSLEDEDSEDTKQQAGYKIRGYCSTEGMDRQDEIVMQKGLDFSEFVNHGYFNDNHKQGTTDIVGIPQKAELHQDRGWYTEGYLLRGYQPAEKIVQLAKALAPTPRRLGFSIEGKVLERSHDNRIVRAKVRNVAITNCPVNTDCTWELVSKAFSDADEIEEGFQRALAAGYGSPGGTGGGALRAQSVETHRKKHKKKELKKFGGVMLSHTRKGMTLGDAVAFLRQLRPQYSEQTCARIARLAAAMTNS